MGGKKREGQLIIEREGTRQLKGQGIAMFFLMSLLLFAILAHISSKKKVSPS